MSRGWPTTGTTVSVGSGGSIRKPTASNPAWAAMGTSSPGGASITVKWARDILRIGSSCWVGPRILANRVYSENMFIYRNKYGDRDAQQGCGGGIASPAGP